MSQQQYGTCLDAVDARAAAVRRTSRRAGDAARRKPEKGNSSERMGRKANGLNPGKGHGGMATRRAFRAMRRHDIATAVMRCGFASLEPCIAALVSIEAVLRGRFARTPGLSPLRQAKSVEARQIRSVSP